MTTSRSSGVSAPVIVLADVEAAAAKATPGPWIAEQFNDGEGKVDFTLESPALGVRNLLCGDDYRRFLSGVAYAEAGPHTLDAESTIDFIATASPATVAALCKVIRACSVHLAKEDMDDEDMLELLREHGIVLDPREPAAGARTGVTPAAEGETP